MEAPAPLPDALLTKLRACKPELLALLEAFEERAAIMEFDGGLSRDEAERQTWTITATRFGRMH